MRRYRSVWIVYRKELLETLRDRRTLMAMVVVPIVLYPVLMLILIEALRKETGRREAERYQVIVPTAEHRDWLKKVLAREDAERKKRPDEEPESNAEEGNEYEAEMTATLRARLRGEQIDITLAPRGASLWELVKSQKYHLALLIDPPPNPANLADDVNRIVQMIYRDTDPRSEFVHNSLARIMDDESERIIKARVTRMSGTVASLTPLVTSSLSTASPSQQYAKILAMVVPFLLVTMTVTGAMYPAIDLTAGERERGTLETLAVSPVPVGQIVAGKFCVILTVAMLSTALNLASMSAMVHFSQLDKMIASIGPRHATEAPIVDRSIEARAALRTDDRGPLGQWVYLNERRLLEQEAQRNVGFVTKSAPIVLLAMVPFAVLASAVMLAVCSFARTFKEAQNYMMPVMMAAIIPALVLSYMPTVRLQGVIQVIPVANIVALIRELFLGSYNGSALLISLISTCFYAAAAVAVAAKLYGHEAVLFSDVGSYRAMLKRRFIEPRTYPWPALSLLTVAIIFPAYFYWQSYLVEPRGGAGRLRLIMGLSQLLILAAPPFLLAWYLKLDLRRTFSLKAPQALDWLAALMIAVAIVPVSSLIAEMLAAWIPWLKASGPLFEKQEVLITKGPLFSILLAFAVVPGICEELLFRGFLLAGLREKLSTAGTVVAIGVLFGVFHIYIEKIPITVLLGMLLALICLRTGSILPAMVVHIANNGLVLAAARIEPLRQFLGLGEAGINLNSRKAVFAAILLLGLALIARPRGGAARQNAQTFMAIE